jgi:type I restriction enzyme M protein
VLDTGAVTRGSGSKNEDKERNIRRWFVEQDLIEGVILLPDNLFYNTNAAGIIVVLNKRKPAAKKNRIVLMNASRVVRKGQPKNFIPEDQIRPLALAFLTAEPAEGQVAVITRAQAEESDYNLSPSRWVVQAGATTDTDIVALIEGVEGLSRKAAALDLRLTQLLNPLRTAR